MPIAHAQQFVADDSPKTIGQSLNAIQQRIAAPDPGIVDGVTITDVLARAILFLLGLSAVIAVLAVVVGGIYYIASFGDEGRAKTGKNIVKYAVIGLLVSGGAFFIIELVRSVVVGN